MERKMENIKCTLSAIEGLSKREHIPASAPFNYTTSFSEEKKKKKETHWNLFFSS